MPGQDHVHLGGGFSLVEAILATVVAGVLLLSVGGAFVASMKSVHVARQTNHATRFLEQTLASLDAQPYANLLAMDGNTINGAVNTTAAPFSAEVSVTRIGIDLLRYSVVLRRTQSGRELTRIVSLRSR